MRSRASTKARTCRSNWFRHAANSGSPAAKPARRIWCRWRVPPASHRKSHIRPTILGHAESGGSRHGRLDRISLSHNRWNPTRFGRTANRRQQRIPHSLFRHKKSGRPTGSGPRQRRDRKGVTPVFGKHLIHRLISVLIRNRGILQQTIVSSILLYRHNQINN